MMRRVLCSVFALALLTPLVWADDALEVVESKFVCMVNDAAYDKEQVRVDVDDKAYYGCCEMCKARLAENEHLRLGIDPISGNEVDKATAIIAADAYKRVYYFENEVNLKKANEKLKEKK